MLSRIVTSQVRVEMGSRGGAEGRWSERPVTEFPRSGCLSKTGTQIKAGLWGLTEGLRREKYIGVSQENAREMERAL